MTAPLDDPDEHLYRQVHPKWIQNGIVSSLAFRPMPKDDGKLSTDRSSLCTAAVSYERYTREGWQSVGVWAITVGEASAHDLPTYADPDPEGRVNPAHALTIFSGFTSGQIKRKSQALAKIANDRGCQHDPDGG